MDHELGPQVADEGAGDRLNSVTAELLTSDQVDRFWSRIERTDILSCWPWIGNRNETGRGLYGIMVAGKKRSFLAHRLAWELQYGESIPEGMTIDHVCRVPICCNPFHLDVVTGAENSRRARRTSGISKPWLETQNGRWRTGWREYSTLGIKRRARSFATESEAGAFAAHLLATETVERSDLDEWRVLGY